MYPIRDLYLNYVKNSYNLIIFKFFYTFLKVTFHLQLLQNIGYIRYVLQLNYKKANKPIKGS